jgi:nucleotide-binding universal stress UspA family protein
MSQNVSILNNQYQTMKNVLCPTDFSQAADHAIAYAAKLCKNLGAELTLLNVQSVFSLPVEEVVKGKYLATEQAREKLDEQSYQVMDVFGISCLSEIEASNSRLSDIIIQRAKDFDLIVMGTNGANDYYEFFFGSGSYQVAKESSVPVLLIPVGCGYQDIANIVFAFDYEHEEYLPLIQLVKFTAAIKARITIMQVKDHYQREAEVYANQVVERAKRFYNLKDLEFETIFSDDVNTAINSYVLKSKADGLALCSTHHSFIDSLFHKSVIKQLSSFGNYPIFIFHN